MPSPKRESTLRQSGVITMGPNIGPYGLGFRANNYLVTGHVGLYRVYGRYTKARDQGPILKSIDTNVEA